MSDSLLIKSDDDFSTHSGTNSNYFALFDHHHHNDFEIIYISSGKIEITINNKVYVADSNTIVLINNMEPHRYTILEYPYSRHVLMFKQNYLSMFANEPVLASIFNYRPKNFNHLIKLSPEHIPFISDLFAQIDKEYRETRPYWEKSIKMQICQLVIFLYRIAEKSFPLSSMNHTIYKTVIINIQNYIDEHFMEEINLKDMANMFHTNMYYLSHLFKDITGNTFKDYLIQRRISYAKDLLSYTSKAINEIAVDTGFSSVNHFIRTFKKTVLITPYQYRKNFRKSSERNSLEKEQHL